MFLLVASVASKPRWNWNGGWAAIQVSKFTLVNGDNFFLFTPMLHELAASDLS
jgi:hypothetical protein